MLSLAGRVVLAAVLSSGTPAESQVPVSEDFFGCGPSDQLQVCGFNSGSFTEVTTGTDALSKLRIPADAHSVDATFGPFDESCYGFKGAEVHLFEVLDNSDGLDGVQLRLVLVVVATHFKRTFVYGDSDDRMLWFRRSPLLAERLDLPAGPTVPMIRLAVSWTQVELDGRREFQVQHLIDLRPDYPRFCAIGNCSRKSECGETDQELRHRTSTECRWDPLATDFLCEIVNSSPFGWAWRTEHRWHYLLSNERIHTRRSDRELREEVVAFATQPMEVALWQGRTRQIGRLGPVTSVSRLPAFSGRGSIGVLAAPAADCFFVVEQEPPGRASLAETCSPRGNLGDEYYAKPMLPYYDRPEEVHLSQPIAFSSRLLYRGRPDLLVYEITETVASRPNGHRVVWLGIERRSRRIIVDQADIATDMPSSSRCGTTWFPETNVGVTILHLAETFGAELDSEPAYLLRHRGNATAVYGSRECPRRGQLQWVAGQGFTSEGEEAVPGCGGFVRRVRISSGGRLAFQELSAGEWP